MTPLEREVFDCIRKLIGALTPAARAEIRAAVEAADAADREVLIDEGAGPIHGNVA